jgi:hypothetical protein
MTQTLRFLGPLACPTVQDFCVLTPDPVCLGLGPYETEGKLLITIIIIIIIIINYVLNKDIGFSLGIHSSPHTFLVHSTI